MTNMGATVILAWSDILRDNTIFVFPDDAVFPEELKHFVGGEPTDTVSTESFVAWLLEKEQEKYQLVDGQTVPAFTVKKIHCVNTVEY